MEERNEQCIRKREKGRDVRMKYLRTAARVRVLHYLYGLETGASVEIKRQFYTAAVCSVLDYSAPCLPELSNTSYQSLKVVQNGAMRAILGAPLWTSVVTLRKECGLPSVKNHILARTFIALVAYLHRWPATHLSTQFCQVLQPPPTATPERNWVHTAADATCTLGD